MRRTTVILVAAMAMAGCGYHAGYTVRKDVRSLAVVMAANRTFYRGIEVDLTRQLITAAEKKTPYRLVDSAAADAVLETTITEYRTVVLQEDADNNAVERELVVAVKYTLSAAGSSRILSEGEVKEAESYAPTIGQTEAEAKETLFRRTATRLVESALEEDW